MIDSQENSQINNKYTYYIWLVLIFALISGVARSFSLAWLCDDSFLSMRYAENWINGLGLVYNSGEHVEGYTNFLWIMWMTLAPIFRTSIPVFSKYSSLLFYVALIAVLIWHSTVQAQRRKQLFFPLAAFLAALSSDFHIWATGGLETIFFALLATLSLLATRIPKLTVHYVITISLLWCALLLTRLDGVLFLVVAFLSILFPNNNANWQNRLKLAIVATILPAITLIVWLALKWKYYGEIFPTAFYSKSVMDPNYTQGFIYLRLFLTKNWYLVPALGFVCWSLFNSRSSVTGYRKDILFYLTAALVYVIYVIHVGGDFMFARRFIPVLPLIFIAMELTIMEWVDKSVYLVAMLFITTGCAMLTINVYGKSNRVDGVANEPAFYTDEIMAQRYEQAKVIKKSISRLNAKVMIDGGYLNIAYYSELPYVVEATGLTQYEIAKQKLNKRGLIGHEKIASVNWLYRNDVALRIHNDYPRDVLAKKYQLFNEMIIGGIVRATIIRYYDALMGPLSEDKNVSFLNISQVITLTRMSVQQAGTFEEAQALLNQLINYYFFTPNASSSYPPNNTQLYQSRLDELRTLVTQKRIPAKKLN